MSALERLEAALTAAGCNPRRGTAKCPAHDDQRASLSYSAGRDGRALLTCHVGCHLDAILVALSMSRRDLFDETTDKPVISATYDYTDQDGNTLFQVVRYAPKAFRQRRPDGGGGWTWKLNGVERVPYRLPELITAVRNGNTVFIAEGEKDVESIRRGGDVATCNPGGAGKWQAGFARYFHDADVVVVADRDEPGRAHARQVAANLRSVARRVRMSNPSKERTSVTTWPPGTRSRNWSSSRTWPWRAAPVSRRLSKK